MAWMETKAREAYGHIIEADRMSRQERGGHGNALAQAYNHMIMPLASRHDKETQVIWGMQDFRHRYGRDPEGMWLPEAAVDIETLEVLAAQGIKFTILAPSQAKRSRPISGGPWKNVDGGRIDPGRCYRLTLEGGRIINLFFYYAELAHAVAFGQILRSGDEFIKNIEQLYRQDYPEDQLVHIATDGETYGHHHRFGEMALAYTLEHLCSQGEILITNYGEFLAEHPPEWEVEILERTSWSCAHGVERWRADCGCRLGTDPGWNQAWRAPLRDALDWLKLRLDEIYEKQTKQLLIHPWKARNAYIDVILERGEESVGRFFAHHVSHKISATDRIRLLQMMEMQRNGMLMFTSDGWFFDEISRLEPVQNLKYAARAIQLAEQSTGVPVEKEFISRLSPARSNIPSIGNGADIYRRIVKPSMVNLPRVVTHYAISSLFEDYEEKGRIYNFAVHREKYQKSSRGDKTLAVGMVSAVCSATEENERFVFAVLHSGGCDFRCSLLAQGTAAQWEKMAQDLIPKLEQADITELIRALDQIFGKEYMTLRDLFLERRREIALLMIEDARQRFESNYRIFYNENRELMRFLKDIDVPIPDSFTAAAQNVLRLDLMEALERALEVEPGENISRIMQEAKLLDIVPMEEGIEQKIRRLLEEKLRTLTPPAMAKLVPGIIHLLDLADRIGIQINLWEAQNIFLQLLNARWHLKEKAKDLPEWKPFFTLGERLGFNLSAYQNPQAK
jgi:alpha-amylase/alpha-mannosidase (GH57 family)